MPTFSLLADPARYVPCSTENMLVDHEYREYWLRHFETHFGVVAALALENYGPAFAAKIDACRADLTTEIVALRRNPAMFGHLDLLLLDVRRQEKLIAHGIPDPFEKMKQRENAAVLPLYPRVVEEIDTHRSEADALLLAVEGVFAGNIYDLGAGATAKLFANSSPDFIKVRNELGGKGGGRPWLVDHFHAMCQRILQRPHKQCIFFCDNAGSDLILGVLPFCRFLARRGTRVLIAANHSPALNDMTHKELVSLLPQIQAIDPLLDELVSRGKILPIDSGGAAPLIDLREVSHEVNHHADQTDLVILEGMGRALESNFEAKFKVDAIKLCMIKEEIVARRHGGKLFDTVCRFDPARV
ncbi:MAG: ARMT1-like domain-containing protein [Phycisphaerales bacterium]|nr:ARMT1-like domain-containing protein [Phycisphaerales bacterium]